MTFRDQGVNKTLPALVLLKAGSNHIGVSNQPNISLIFTVRFSKCDFLAASATATDINPS